MSPVRDPSSTLHPVAQVHADDYRDGKIGRREFLARATALGVTAIGAYGLIGATAPARAAGHARAGGTLRIQQGVRPMTEPRLFEWSEIGNISRGWLEHLVTYNRDGTFSPVLLESWEVNGDATVYRLFLRQGVTWNNGDAFTSADVLANFRGWCDTSVEGSSTPGRMGGLVDPATGQMREGAVVAEDDHTLVLTFPKPDIAIIAGLSDYPMVVQHRNHIGANPIETPIGTGAYRPVEYEPGVRAVIEKNADHVWWNAGNGAFLDRIEFVDYGTDPASALRALEAGEIDMTYQSVGEFIAILDDLGFARSETATAATLVCRPNAKAEVDGLRPYADARVRRALALAVDNRIVLEIGYADRGVTAENHHIAPVHPAYADLPPIVPDPDAAFALMSEAGMEEFEHEIISLDDGFERDSTDAVAAQLRDAGFSVTRTVLPGSTYFDRWRDYPFSTTTWNHRPLDIQVPLLAYKSDGVWNETGFASEEYDRLLEDASALTDADARRDKVRRMQEIMQEEGVVIQPYWRTLYRHAIPGLTGAEMHPQFEIAYQYIGFTR